MNILPVSSCDRCCFYAHNPYLVCAPHPTGPDSNPCRDFEEATPEQRLQAKDWFYPSNWLPLQTRQRLAEEDWMAFWTGNEDESLDWGP
ncbi:MAG: hypothetical protein ICV77_17640 [Cyanobacteria bacterium Co-bin8]|nr:hypothetical protein [Cyanobacteria bacterium Co-bin8]